MKKRSLLLTLLLAIFITGVQAQSDSAATKGNFTINGYVDTYYQYNLNDPVTRLNQGRIFDIRHDNFTIGLVQTMLTYTYGKSKVVADLTYGPNAELGNFGNSGTAIAIKQAYLSYNVTDKLAFTIGQYGTHIGYELIDAPLNYNYSLSYLFGNGPFYHTGAKLDYAVSDKVGLMFGVVNGWDALTDFNDKKSLTGQVHVAPIEGFHVYANVISGDEYGGLSAFGQKSGSKTNLFDLVTTYQVTDAFKIGINAAFGKFYTGYDREITEKDIEDAATNEAAEFLAGEQKYSKDQDWSGAALYLNLAVSEKFGLGLRAEHFADAGGVRYFGSFTGQEYTLTGDVKLADGHFNFKPEFRLDTAKDPFFVDSKGGLKKSQATIGGAFIYTFGSK